MSRLRSILAASAVFVLLIVFVTSAGAAAPEGSLEGQLARLTERIAVLEQEMAALKTDVQPQRPDPQAEQTANRELQAVQALVRDGNLQEAKARMDEFMRTHAGTAAGAKGRGLHQELGVVGRAAPEDWGIEHWFQGENDIDLGGDDTTIIVFWETWCPHCRREVPKLQKLYTEYRDQGLQILGLSRFSRGATEEQFLSFIDEHGLEFPMARDDGSLSAHFGVGGIPALAVLRHQAVVWRGHPARITPEMLDGWLR